MEITYLGHSCLKIETKGKTLLVDPFITGNPLASHIDVDELSVDYILVTHGHEDHVLDVERVAKNNPDALLISNYEIVQWFAKKGVKGHPMNHGGKVDFDFGIVKYELAVHSSSMPDGSYGGNPGGFVIANDDAVIYIAGDTALTKDMELIPMFFPKVDLCVLPIGDNFTMGYEEARKASEYVRSRRVLGVHYNTFPMIEVDLPKAQAHFIARNRELVLLDIGEKMIVKG